METINVIDLNTLQSNWISFSKALDSSLEMLLGALLNIVPTTALLVLIKKLLKPLRVTKNTSVT